MFSLYKYVSQTGYHEDVGSYQTYGIVLADTGRIIMDDVGCKEDFAKSIADTLNQNEVEPIHALYVIEDMIASQ